MIKKYFLLHSLFLLCFFSALCQDIDKVINPLEAERIERILSADDMQGRKTFTPGIDKAGKYIVDEFSKAGLSFFNDLHSYKQEFSMIKSKFVSAAGNLDGQALDTKNIISISTMAELTINEHSGYEVVKIGPGSNMVSEASRYIRGKKNLLVIVDTSFSQSFGRLLRFKRESFKSERNVLFVLSAFIPTKFDIQVKQELSESHLANIIGIIPGKSKKDEFVIFSGHYDHLGIGKPNAAGDSIYNGANDDAAGITAVILLAKYFNQLHNNERTLVFVAFTAEEIGGFGSRYFSQQMDPDKVVAMFNIEMIGTQSKWGTNSAYITGYEKSNMGSLLQANLTGSPFHFEPDPYPSQNLFYRSDNATLAALGVPAHTISTSKMDNEPNYHKVTDEISTLDLENMTAIIKAIALSSKSIISGKDTPTRVEKPKE